MRDIVKVYQIGDEEQTVLKGISLTVYEGEFISVLGPSGSGKSTLMNIIGCLDIPTSGTYILGGRNIPELDQKQLARIRNREIGFVFQSFQLLPRLTALENVELPLIYARVSPSKRRKRAEELLIRVGLEDKMYHRPNQLSGGQQQRVAIARALVLEPSIICMDEPLSNLDAKLRVQLRNELKKMQKDFGITTIYVTHDQEEALTLSDRIAVFNKGVIEQIGTPNEVYNYSRTEFVCNFIGDINRLCEDIVRQMAVKGAQVDPGKHNYIRLERVHVNTPPTEEDLVLDARVDSREYYGIYIKYYLDLGCQTIKVIERNDGVNIYEPGQMVKVVINPRDIMAYPANAAAEER